MINVFIFCIKYENNVKKFGWIAIEILEDYGIL